MRTKSWSISVYSRIRLFIQYLTLLQVLIHNAAAIYGAFNLSVDNFESQMTFYHFGTILLTKLLAPKLMTSVTPSFVPYVVLVSSSAHTHW